MAGNKKTSPRVASKAAKIINDPNASVIQKRLAGSALSQSRTRKQTGKEMETLASNVLSSGKYNKDTKTLAGTVLTQSNKKR
jgi:hypothetical protein